jgi:hypothetical protein
MIAHWSRAASGIASAEAAAKSQRYKMVKWIERVPS